MTFAFPVQKESDSMVYKIKGFQTDHRDNHQQGVKKRTKKEKERIYIYIIE